MTTPTNQEDIEEILLGLVDWAESGQTLVGRPDDTYDIKQATQAINTIIANKCNEARIDELERAYPYFRIEEVAYGTAPHYYTDRLKELEGDK